MKNLILMLIPMLLIMLTNSTALAAENDENMPILSVSGEGTIEATPDRATISIGVVTQDKNATRVQMANAQAAQGIINSIVALGVERKNIHTSDYNFRPTYRQDENHRNEINGYMVNNTVNVVVDNLDLVGKIVDAALNHGANNINSLDFGIKNRRKLQDDALVLAIRDAKQRAELVARELGKSIIGIKDISINSGHVGIMRANKNMAFMESAVADYDTPIEAGTMTCSASVHIDFILSK